PSGATASVPGKSPVSRTVAATSASRRKGPRSSSATFASRSWPPARNREIVRTRPFAGSSTLRLPHSRRQNLRACRQGGDKTDPGNFFLLLRRNLGLDAERLEGVRGDPDHVGVRILESRLQGRQGGPCIRVQPVEHVDRLEASPLVRTFHGLN